MPTHLMACSFARAAPARGLPMTVLVPLVYRQGVPLSLTLASRYNRSGRRWLAPFHCPKLADRTSRVSSCALWGTRETMTGGAWQRNGCGDSRSTPEHLDGVEVVF